MEVVGWHDAGGGAQIVRGIPRLDFFGYFFDQAKSDSERKKIGSKGKNEDYCKSGAVLLTPYLYSG